MSTDSTKFVHLHLHSHYSMLDGMGKIPDLVKKAKDLGMPAIALTDHGVMHGAIEFYTACKKAGIKPIIGCEVYVAPRTLRDKAPRVDANPYHLILLAKNHIGYQNLLKLVSIAHLEGYYYKPRVDKVLLKKYSEGLIACSACIGGEIPHRALGDIHEGRKAVREYLDIFTKDNLCLEVQHHPKTVPEQNKANEMLYELAREFDLKVIATNDPHYVNSDDRLAHDALMCLQTGKLLSDPNRLSMVNDDYSMLAGDEIAKNFPDHPEVISNTLKVAESCDLEIELGKFRFPEFPLPEGETNESYLKKLIDERLPKVVPNITPMIQERIDYEFKVIKNKGYLGYFLIVQDFFQFAKKHSIPTNTRGSAAGCMISYVLGITAKQLNPIDYNLPFERFLNPFRPSAPDIDADIADSGRDAIIQYVSKKYGEDHVAQIITFGTMAARMAVRDVGRVLGMSYSEVDIIAKLIPPIKTNLDLALKNIAELKNLYDSNEKVKQCIDIAKRLEGVARHASVHAAGVVIAPEPITNFSPMMKDSKGNRLITQYEMNSVGEDGVGLIKMDFLGLANLSIIQNVIKIIEKTRDKKIILDEIPLDDKKTFELLSRGETIGVFQLESEGMRKNIKELRPTTIHDIMAMVALYRPGPMSFIPEYVARKNDPSRIKYLDSRLKSILEKSLGLIVYQDDVLMIAIELAGYNWAEVDKFRKAIGKKIVKEMKAQKEKFFKQIIERGMKEEIANELWIQIETFAGYGFNKSHAASYGLVAYQTAYLKSNYPEEYMSALLTSNKDDLDKLAIEINECARMNIAVLPPSINESFVDFGVVKDSKNIRFGLSAVKNVGVAVAEAIIDERKANGKYRNLEDFATRLDSKVINKKSLESLVMSGALDEFMERGNLIYNLEKVLLFANQVHKDRDNNQNSLFGASEIPKIKKIAFEETAPAEKKQRLTWERELLGMYVSEHPLSDMAHIIEQNQTKKTSSVTPEIEGDFVRLAGIITSVQKILTRSNQNMAFARLEDMKGNIEVLVFPKLFAENSDIWQPDQIMAIDGYINFKDGTPKILAEAVYPLSDKSIIPAFVSRKNKNGNGFHKPSSPPNTQYLIPDTKFQTPNTKYPIPDTPLRPASPMTASWDYAGQAKYEIRDTLKSLIITLPNGSDRSTLLDIKAILVEAPGESSVILRVPNNGAGYKETKIKNTVLISPVLLNRLREVVGKENVKTI